MTQRYQTQEFADLMQFLEFNGIFSDKFKSEVFKVYAAQNIEEVFPIFMESIDALNFLEVGFKNKIRNAFNNVILYRKNNL